MRLLAVFLLFFISVNVFGQYINGPANVREMPKGEILFSLNDYVQVNTPQDSLGDDWHSISIWCEVNPSDLINKTLIKPNAKLYARNGKSIGQTLSQFEVSNSDINSRNYSKLEKIRIVVKGVTFKTNIREKLSEEDIKATKKYFVDDSDNKYISYKEDDGTTSTQVKQTKYHNPYIKIDGTFQNVLVKETYNIVRNTGMEGQECTIDLEIVSDCFSENPQRKSFSVEADEVKFGTKYFETTKYGCCSAPNTCKLYQIKSFKELMTYDNGYCKVEIPNTDIVGFIGFDLGRYDKNKRRIGTVIYSSLDSVINRVDIVTNDTQKYDSIARLSPKIELKNLNDKDRLDSNKTILKLWSKNKSEGRNSLTDFCIIIPFYGDGSLEYMTQRVQFKNGFINGNPKKEFEIVID